MGASDIMEHKVIGDYHIYNKLFINIYKYSLILLIYV